MMSDIAFCQALHFFISAPPLLLIAFFALLPLFACPCEIIRTRIHHCISGLVVEYIVAIDVTRVRFPADAFASKAASNSWAQSPIFVNSLSHSVGYAMDIKHFHHLASLFKFLSQVAAWQKANPSRAPCGIRTHDLPLTERVLHQLS